MDAVDMLHCAPYTECPVTLCQYFRILFLGLFPARNINEHDSDSQRFRCYGQKLKMIWTTQNTIADVLPASRGTPHFRRYVTEYLNEQLTDRWIGRRGPQNWPLRSPDLTPLDFHVQDCMINMVCEHKQKRETASSNYRCWKTHLWPWGSNHPEFQISVAP
jgi:hypothetical protein